MKLEESIDIAVPPDSVWPMITKRENVFKVDRLIKKFDFVGEQPSGIGKMFYMEKEIEGRLIRSLCIFTEWEENKKLAFRQFLGGDVKGMQVAYTIEATKTGSRITLMHEVTMPYWIIGKIIEMLAIRPVMKEVGPEVVANIKKLAEAQKAD
jgi:hypothetical protein